MGIGDVREERIGADQSVGHLIVDVDGIVSLDPLEQLPSLASVVDLPRSA
jgi:hypothetical protein